MSDWLLYLVPTSGIIELRDYDNLHDHVWEVNSGCDNVRIVSTHFDTEPGFDHVTIEGESYSGFGGQVDQIVPGTFTVSFVSDHSVTSTGFELTWSCFAPVTTSEPAG